MSTRARRQLADRVVSLAATALAIILAAPSRALAQDQCDPSAGTIYAPGQGTSGLVLFEDLWNRNGDLDFNDQAIVRISVHRERGDRNIVNAKIGPS